MIPGMTGLRRVGVLAVIAATIPLGLALVWRILPLAMTSATAIPTVELLVLTCLCIFPVAGAWCLRSTRRPAGADTTVHAQPSGHARVAPRVRRHPGVESRRDTARISQRAHTRHDDLVTAED